MWMGLVGGGWFFSSRSSSSSLVRGIVVAVVMNGLEKKNRKNTQLYITN